VIYYSIFYVIETFKELVCQHPSRWPIIKLGPHPLFLCLKLKWKASNEIWFMTTLITHNGLCFIVDKLIVNFPNLKNKASQRCWNYVDGGCICTSTIQYGGNTP
jgi:hypothetical protein